MRLRRTSPDRTGWSRRRSGRGWTYLDENGRRVADADAKRIKALVIPPAWTDVWISPAPNGHIQAVGSDEAGRRQYIYHQQWRVERGREKFDRILTVARRLPKARAHVANDLALEGMPRERALAAAFRMLDLGYFRVGGESYTEANGSYGLATLRKDHLRVRKGEMIFEFVAKSGKAQLIVLRDAVLMQAISTMRRRRGRPDDDLLAYRQGRGWVDVSSDDINEYVKSVLDPEVSAKDFRTWHATVQACIALAILKPPPTTDTARKKAVIAAVRDVSDYLGNTPAIARRSYVDPRVIDLYDSGVSIARALTRLGTEPDFEDPTTYAVAERAVARMLRA